MKDNADPKSGTSRIDVPANVTKPRMGWGSDVVAEAMRVIGLEYIALVPGASFRGLHDSIVNYLGNAGPQIILCLHEEHAVSIADGYGKVTQTPMGVALHSNVGLMHATMTIFNAWCDRTPMVIFGATGPVDAYKRRPWIDWIHTTKDQGALVRHYTKWDDQPVSVQASVESVLRANRIARTPPYGPVYVCLDVTMQEAPLAGNVTVPPAERFAPAPLPEAPRESVRQATESLKKARFPVVLAGRVSRDPADWDRRVRLAEAIGGAVLTSFHNPPAFPTEHPLHVLPPCGEHITQAEKDLMARADVILSLDWLDLAGYLRACSGNAQTQQPVDATVIHCTLEHYLTNGWSLDHQALAAVDVPVSAHPDRFIAQLLEAFAENGNPARSLDIPHWTKAVAESSPPIEEGALTVEGFAASLSAFAQEREVTFARLPMGWPANVCRYRGPLDYMGKDGGAAVGTGPGHSVGTALALKDSGRLVVGVIGDGDFLMGVNALWTASHMELPLMIVVSNNRSYYNDELHQERVAKTRGRPPENKWIGQKLDAPPIDLVAMAKAQGFEGESVEGGRAALARALARGAEVVGRGGRYFIDARVEPGYADR